MLHQTHLKENVLIQMQPWVKPPICANENICTGFEEKNAAITVCKSTGTNVPHKVELWLQPRNIRRFNLGNTVQFLRDNPQLLHRTHGPDVHVWFALPVDYSESDIDKELGDFIDLLKDLSIFPMVNAYQ